MIYSSVHIDPVFHFIRDNFSRIPLYTYISFNGPLSSHVSSFCCHDTVWCVDIHHVYFRYKRKVEKVVFLDIKWPRSITRDFSQHKFLYTKQYLLLYRVFIKYCVLLLKMLWFFWSLPVLLQRLCSTCHYVVRVHKAGKPRTSSQEYILKFVKKDNI